MRPTSSIAVLVACLALPGAGCGNWNCSFNLSFALVGSRTEVSGRGVPEDTLAQVKPRETAKAWVLRFLGEPTTRETIADGTEVLTYVYERKTETRSGILLLFGRTRTYIDKTTVHVELKDDLVQRIWRERG